MRDVKMKKSLLWIMILVLSVSMIAVFSLAGCKTTTTTETTAAATTAATTAAGETTAATTAAAATELIKVGIVNLPPEESGYRQANVEDMNNVFSQANGYDAKQTNTGDNSEQIAAAKGYIRDGVDYLLISAANASGWDDTLKSAKDAGITVILFDRAIETDPSNYQAALLSDMAYEGKTVVEWVLKQGLDPINLVLIRGQLGSAAEIGRSDAVLEAEKAGKLKIVADGTGGDTWSLEEARKVVEAAIAANKEFDVIYAENDGMAQGAVQALEAAGISHGKDGKVKIIGFDFNRFALRNIQEGYWDADMQCNPRQAAEISKWIKSNNLPSGITYQKELLLDTAKITDEDIEKWGINADPGKGVITR
jgi:galactofuranose transport system substrate-binding protein